MSRVRLAAATLIVGVALAAFADRPATAFTQTDSFTFSGNFFLFAFNLADRRNDFGSVSPN